MRIEKSGQSAAKKCYWCGNPATSVEHVPPRNLFPVGHTKDLITVPSCKAHNEDLHLLDERFRFYIQACGTNDVALVALKDKTIRSLSRPERPGLVKSLASKSHRINVGGHPTFAMEINPSDQNLYFEKIVRGMYFHLLKQPAVGQVVSASEQFIVPGLDYEHVKKTIVPLLNVPKFAVLGQVSNPKVFQYKYAHVIEKSRKAFAIMLRFYEGVEVLGLVIAAN